MAGCLFFLSTYAQETQPQGAVQAPKGSSQWKDKYCASTRDGNTIIMNGKTELAVNMTLGNGSTITTDGYLIKKDGTKIALQSGDCVDKNGNLIGGKKTNGK